MSYETSKENLSKYQDNLIVVVTFFILLNWMFEQVVILNVKRILIFVAVRASRIKVVVLTIFCENLGMFLLLADLFCRFEKVQSLD